MKYMKKLLAVLLAVLMLAAVCGCSLLESKPVDNGGKSETVSTPATRAPAATTASAGTAIGTEPIFTDGTAAKTEPKPPETTVPATEPVDQSVLLTRLYGDLFRSLTASRSSVVYDDDEVGQKLRASANLTREDDIWTYQAKINRLNAVDEESFTSEETLDPVTGTIEDLCENSASIFVWDRLLFSSPSFSRENLISPEITQDAETFTLKASIADDKLEEVFGIALSGVSGVKIEIAYTATSVLTMKLNYTAGSATVSVTVTYTY